MWVELPPLWIVALNVAVIPAIHLSVAWLFTRLPRGWFTPDHFLFRERRWERQGRLYERVFAIRSWKRWLPDGAPWLRGFAKKRMRRRDPGYLREFTAETCRSEAAHLAQIPAVLLVLAWNPWPWAAGVIISYAILSNLPCILVLRYTRHRMAGLLAERTRAGRKSP